MSKMYKPTRYEMYKELSGFLKDKEGNALFISGSNPIKEMFKWVEATEVYYPEYDICNLNITSDYYDFVVADQVIEHVKNPFLAADEMKRVLKTGGMAIITSVFCYPIHEYPKDYWRFTPDGLRQLCSNFASIELCGGFGNPDMVSKIIAGIKSGFFTSNDPSVPVMVWIVAKK